MYPGRRTNRSSEDSTDICASVDRPFATHPCPQNPILDWFSSVRRAIRGKRNPHGLPGRPLPASADRMDRFEARCFPSDRRQSWCAGICPAACGRIAAPMWHIRRHPLGSAGRSVAAFFPGCVRRLLHRTVLGSGRLGVGVGRHRNRGGFGEANGSLGVDVWSPIR